jgi:hypothetical protein
MGPPNPLLPITSTCHLHTKTHLARSAAIIIMPTSICKPQQPTATAWDTQVCPCKVVAVHSSRGQLFGFLVGLPHYQPVTRTVTVVVTTMGMMQQGTQQQ